MATTLSPGADALLTQLRAAGTATLFDKDAAEELIGEGYAVLVPGAAMIEITEAGRTGGTATPPAATS